MLPGFIVYYDTDDWRSYGWDAIGIKRAREFG
jgi:hypothetical protein